MQERERAFSENEKAFRAREKAYQDKEKERLEVLMKEREHWQQKELESQKATVNPAIHAVGASTCS